MSHAATHTRHDDRRVYTDARSNYYDTNVQQVPCMCDHGRDHHQVVERVPFVPSDDD